LTIVIAVAVLISFLQRNKKKSEKDAINAVYAKLLTSRSLNSSNVHNAVNITDDEDIVTRLLR